MHELFPSLSTIQEGQSSVKVGDCQAAGSKRPLRLLNSFFCLNTSSQYSITIHFAKLVLAALNGEKVDWPLEFFDELKAEVLTLHRHQQEDKAKVIRTAIGPHLTLILKAAGVMNLRHEAEAGFHMVSPSSAYKPHKKRCTDAPIPSPKPQSTVRVVPNKVIDLEQESSVPAPPPQSSEIPQSTVYETEEPWQIPNDIPNLVQQITQAHRRLENLLTTLTSKAPPRLIRNVGHQFHKLQRETILKEGSGPGKGQTKSPPTNMINSLTAQIGRLEEKLANKEELMDLYIENSFETQNQSVAQEEELERLRKEIHTITRRDQEELIKLQDLEKTQIQLREKEEEAVNLERQVQTLIKEATIQKQKVKELHTTQQQAEEELTRLRTEIAIVTTRNREDQIKIQDLEQTQFLLKAKEWEATNLEHQVQQLTAEAAIHKQKISELQKTQQQGREEFTRLRTEE